MKVTKKIWLIVGNGNGIILDDDKNGMKIFWDLKIIKGIIKKKLKKVAFVYGDKRINNGKIEVKYTKMIYYRYTSIKTFVKLINDNKICMEIKLGEHLTGSLAGQAHDHGSCFRLKNPNIFNELFKYGDTF